LKVSKLSIANFRGIKSATLIFPDHAVLIGDNNTGKSTVLEAIDLVLGPDRLNRRPPVDEHDFHLGEYLVPKPPLGVAEGEDGNFAAGEAGKAEAGEDGQAELGAASTNPRIEIEIVISDLSLEQQARFGDHIEWLDTGTNLLYGDADPVGVDAANIKAAMRCTFIGEYDEEEDDFIGATYFSRTLSDGDAPVSFSKKDKQRCGFLYLRSLRTGSRALGLEHGSLLDIILRLKEIRPQMWEDTIASLAAFNVASDPKLGISGVLESINVSLKKYVPREWGVKPQGLVARGVGPNQIHDTHRL
jgi:putative ATP-dependent endonuclease of OLD family